MSSERAALVGRERHPRELNLPVDAITASRDNVVVLSGEAGAGKTRLAEEAAARASGAGVEVAWATCWSNAGAPLSTWMDLLAIVSRQATSTTPPRGSATAVDPEVARALLVRALVAEPRHAIGGRPTLLAVDDLQWCDPLSLRAIEALIGTVRASPIGLVATFRDDGEPAAARLEPLSRVGRHLFVLPLTEIELVELALEATGRRYHRRWSPDFRTAVREREFVHAVRALRAPDMWIIMRHVLPNTVGLVVVHATIVVPAAILAVASLSFLGFGVPPPTPSLGGLIAESRSATLTDWWLVVFPGLAIAALCLAVNLVGEGIRAAVDVGRS